MFGSVGEHPAEQERRYENRKNLRSSRKHHLFFNRSSQCQCAISPAAFVATASAPNLALPQVQAHSDPGPADAAEDSGRDNASVVGFWKVTFTSGGQVVDQGFGQWHRDRTEILSDTANGPAHGNLCMGAWAKTGPRTYKLNHLGLTFDLN